MRRRGFLLGLLATPLIVRAASLDYVPRGELLLPEPPTVVSNGIWTPAVGQTFTRNWQRDGIDIPGEIGDTYTLTPADRWSTIRLRITANNTTIAR
jgi:hypothetical protein